jgi:hypothetical protein
LCGDGFAALTHIDIARTRVHHGVPSELLCNKFFVWIPTKPMQIVPGLSSGFAGLQGACMKGFEESCQPMG